MHSVTIYSTPTCTYCKMAKEYLASKNIPYTDVDVSRDTVAQKQMLDRSGQFGVPVIDVDGKIVIGFDRRKLNEYLGIIQ